VATKAIILARAGSKRIPNKNLVNLKGKPLIAYTIETALNCSSIQEVWVSTNCPSIKRVADILGCKVIDRPEEMCADTSQSEEALLHFSENVDFDTLVFIQPTSPMLEVGDLSQGLSMMSQGYDSVFSVRRDHWEPKWTMDVTPDGWDITNRPRSQDVELKYVENGAFYITSKSLLELTKQRYGGKIGVVEMPNYRSIQVDTKEDLILLENLL
jgi:CMP-N-acetylneuraminic acid synthetase